jgi:hypothetical protein
MTSGSRSASALVPLPCRSGTRTTAGQRVRHCTDRVGGHEREIDREHEERGRATGDDVLARLAQPGVQSARSLPKRPRTEVGGTPEHLPIGADDEHVVESVDGEGRGNRADQQPVDEVLALLRVKRLAKPGLRAGQRADRDDGRDPVAGTGRGHEAASRTARATRARPSASAMTVSATNGRSPSAATSGSSAASTESNTNTVASP